MLETADFPATVVRPSQTYSSLIPASGGAKDSSVVRSDGFSLHVLTHDRDFEKGFVSLLGREDTVGEAFHITSDEVLT